MSHTSTIKAIKITSINALRQAVADLVATGVRCSLVENQKPRAYFTEQQGMGVAPYVLKLENSPYDIGFYKSADGTYEARTDFHAGHIEKNLGARAGDPSRADQARMGKLYQFYGAAVATEAARKQGHTVRRTTNDKGQIKLELVGNF